MEKTKRVIDFSRYKPVLEIPNLIGMQLASFEEFLQRNIPPRERDNKGLEEIFKEVFPVKSYNGKLVLEFIEYNFSKPRYDIERCHREELTYSLPLYVKLRLFNKEIGEAVEQEVYFEDLPLITKEGSFIINGADRVIVSQLQRAPGIFSKENTSSKSEVSFKVNIIPERGSWLEFEVKENLLYMRVNRGKNFLATLFLRALGGTPEKVLKEFSHPEDREILKRSFEIDEVDSHEDVFLKLYQKLRPGRPLVFESTEEVFKKTFQDHRRYDLGKAGRFQLNKELNLNIDIESGILHLEDIIGAIKYLFVLNRERREVKSSDHLSYKRVRRVGDLLAEQFRIGLTYLSKIIQQRMSIQDPATMTPRSLVVTRVVKRVINSFFNTGSLSQYLDQTNPLSELTHKRRLSSLGQGGLSRVQAKEEVRDVHYTYYGRICPIETPEGQNIGLLVSLATYAHINKLGFLEAPYRKVEKGRAAKEVIYLDAREEDNYYIAGINALDREGKFVESEVRARYRGEVITVPQEKVDFVDISPKEIVSITTSLIPFLENDAANRALMGSNMQRQAVPLENPEVPLVKTGAERKIATDSLRAIRAKRGGKVIFADASEIKIKTSEGIDKYRLMKFQRSNQRTCVNQRSLVNKGEEVKEGEFIADGPAIHDGELALGRNILVAFMPWEGYNFQDAILISEKLVKEDVFTSIHVEEFQVEAKELKSGTEEITSDIPNVEESALRNLDEEGIICIGAEVKSGDILVGKVTPQVEVKLTPEERLLRSIFGEKVQKVKDNSLRVPHGIEGKVIRVKAFSQENNDNLPPSVKKRVKVYVAVRRKVRVGDKMCGRHGNKGVVGKILAEEDMPYLPDGTPIEILLSPLGVPSRMNVGQVLETHLGWAAKTLGVEIITPVFEGPKEKEITELLRKASLPESGKITLYDGRTGEPFPEPIAVGYMYMMKLVHLAEEKIHARSTGPYALVTQQPLGGKSREGGQRFGEMEVWALEGYGAAYTLQEMLTSKSDDLQARTNLHERIIKGENFLVTHTPESFKVLVKELQALGLNLEFWKDGKKFTIQDMEKENEGGDEIVGDERY